MDGRAGSRLVGCRVRLRIVQSFQNLVFYVFYILDVRVLYLVAARVILGAGHGVALHHPRNRLGHR